MTTTTPETRCSQVVREPLPGTAKTGTTYVALEHLRGWGRDVLDGEALGEELTPLVAAHLKKWSASLQLIRKPGRAGQHRPRRKMYLIYTGDGDTPPAMEELDVDGPETILELDLSGPGANASLGARSVDHPILLVCSHGKRDTCCALKGRPVAAALQTCFYGDEIWESSHTKGHRFAASMLLMPWGYSYGRLNSAAAIDMLKHATRGEMFLPGNRGRGCFDAPGQVAELVVADRVISAEGSLDVGALRVDAELNEPGDVDGMAADEVVVRRVAHPDGRAWLVQLKQRPVEGVVASCGDAPKQGSTWVVVDVQPVEGHRAV